MTSAWQPKDFYEANDRYHAMTNHAPHTLFWLQTDGMRFTTTAKSGFITGLYVLFTPLIAVAIGQQVKLTSLLGAVIAGIFCYALVAGTAAGTTTTGRWH